MVVRAGYHIQYADGFVNDVWPDAVAGEEGNVEIQCMFQSVGAKHASPLQNQCATINPYSTESASARQLASMMFVLAPTVLQRLVLLRVSINTRVIASVP